MDLMTLVDSLKATASDEAPDAVAMAKAIALKLSGVMSTSDLGKRKTRWEEDEEAQGGSVPPVFVSSAMAGFGSGVVVGETAMGMAPTVA